MSQEKITLRGKAMGVAVNTILTTTNVTAREAAIRQLLGLIDHYTGTDTPEAMRELIHQLVYRNPFKLDALRYRHVRSGSRPHNVIGGVRDNTGKVATLYEGALDAAVDESIEMNARRTGEVVFKNVDSACNCALYPGEEDRPCNQRAPSQLAFSVVESDRPLKSRGKVKHVRTGGAYTVYGVGNLQSTYPLADMSQVYIYQGEDDRLWVRPVTEFIDGRFEDLEGDNATAKPEPTEEEIRHAFLSTRLPVSITVGNGTHGKGTTLYSLLLRMKAMYSTITGRNADAVAAERHHRPRVQNFDPRSAALLESDTTQELSKWLGENAGKAQIPEGVNGITDNDLGDRAEVAGDEVWQAVPEENLDEIEKWLTGKGPQNAAFFPIDAHRLSNICMHLIREVRATRQQKSDTSQVGLGVPAFVQSILDNQKAEGKPTEVKVEQGVHQRRYLVRLAAVHAQRMHHPTSGAPLSIPFLETHDEIDAYLAGNGLDHVVDQLGLSIDTSRWVTLSEVVSDAVWVEHCLSQAGRSWEGSREQQLLRREVE